MIAAPTIGVRFEARPPRERVPGKRGRDVNVGTEALERLRNAYLEMPGLRLTGRQAARLCGLAETLVSSLLEALADEGFLRLTTNGLYARRGTCPSCE